MILKKIQKQKNKNKSEKILRDKSYKYLPQTPVGNTTMNVNLLIRNNRPFLPHLFSGHLSLFGLVIINL